MTKFRIEPTAWLVGCRAVWRVVRPLWAFPLIREADYEGRISPVPVFEWQDRHVKDFGLRVPDDLWMPQGNLRDLVDSVVFGNWADDARRLAIGHRLPEMRGTYSRCEQHLRQEAARRAEIEAREFVLREGSAK